MFNWLKRKPATYPTVSGWTVLNGNYSGKPMFLRRNDSGADLSGHPDYRFRVGVAVPLKTPDKHGLPGSAEMNGLNSIEDLLSSRLEANQQSLHVLSITTGGMREFVFYTRDPSAAQAATETLRSEVTSHELQS